MRLPRLLLHCHLFSAHAVHRACHRLPYRCTTARSACTRFHTTLRTLSRHAAVPVVLHTVLRAFAGCRFGYAHLRSLPHYLRLRLLFCSLTRTFAFLRYARFGCGLPLVAVRSLQRIHILHVTARGLRFVTYTPLVGYHTFVWILYTHTARFTTVAVTVAVAVTTHCTFCTHLPHLPHIYAAVTPVYVCAFYVSVAVARIPAFTHSCRGLVAVTGLTTFLRFLRGSAVAVIYCGCTHGSRTPLPPLDTVTTPPVILRLHMQLYLHIYLRLFYVPLLPGYVSAGYRCSTGSTPVTRFYRTIEPGSLFTLVTLHCACTFCHHTAQRAVYRVCSTRLHSFTRCLRCTFSRSLLRTTPPFVLPPPLRSHHPACRSRCSHGWFTFTLVGLFGLRFTARCRLRGYTAVTRFAVRARCLVLTCPGYLRYLPLPPACRSLYVRVLVCRTVRTTTHTRSRTHWTWFTHTHCRLLRSAVGLPRFTADVAFTRLLRFLLPYVAVAHASPHGLCGSHTLPPFTARSGLRMVRCWLPFTGFYLYPLILNTFFHTTCVCGLPFTAVPPVTFTVTFALHLVSSPILPSAYLPLFTTDCLPTPFCLPGFWFTHSSTVTHRYAPRSLRLRVARTVYYVTARSTTYRVLPFTPSPFTVAFGSGSLVIRGLRLGFTRLPYAYTIFLPPHFTLPRLHVYTLLYRTVAYAHSLVQFYTFLPSPAFALRLHFRGSCYTRFWFLRFHGFAVLTCICVPAQFTAVAVTACRFPDLRYGYAFACLRVAYRTPLLPRFAYLPLPFTTRFAVAFRDSCGYLCVGLPHYLHAHVHTAVRSHMDAVAGFTVAGYVCAVTFTVTVVCLRYYARFLMRLRFAAHVRHAFTAVVYRLPTLRSDARYGLHFTWFTHGLLRTTRLLRVPVTFTARLRTRWFGSTGLPQFLSSTYRLHVLVTAVATLRTVTARLRFTLLRSFARSRGLLFWFYGYLYYYLGSLLLPFVFSAFCAVFMRFCCLPVHCALTFPAHTPFATPYSTLGFTTVPLRSSLRTHTPFYVAAPVACLVAVWFARCHVALRALPAPLLHTLRLRSAVTYVRLYTHLRSTCVYRTYLRLPIATFAVPVTVRARCTVWFRLPAVTWIRTRYTAHCLYGLRFWLRFGSTRSRYAVYPHTHAVAVGSTVLHAVLRLFPCSQFWLPRLGCGSPATVHTPLPPRVRAVLPLHPRFAAALSFSYGSTAFTVYLVLVYSSRTFFRARGLPHYAFTVTVTPARFAAGTSHTFPLLVWLRYVWFTVLPTVTDAVHARTVYAATRLRLRSTTPLCCTHTTRLPAGTHTVYTVLPVVPLHTVMPRLVVLAFPVHMPRITLHYLPHLHCRFHAPAVLYATARFVRARTRGSFFCLVGLVYGCTACLRSFLRSRFYGPIHYAVLPHLRTRLRLHTCRTHLPLHPRLLRMPCGLYRRAAAVAG